MLLTNKQKEFIQEANKTWNFKIGATRSGKTYLDFLYRIPAKTRELANLEGIFVIAGVAQSTVERNVLEPMRALYGKSLVGFIKQGSGTVQLFGETYHVIGHEKSNAVNRIQGTSIKYMYIDEIVSMHESAFEMIKSRLDKTYSCCDATGNPKQPNHFIKQFIDAQIENGDLFYQHYTIDDNIFLPSDFVERLKREYYGTVYYKRFILGMWALAEGAIYPMLSQNHKIKMSEWNNVDKNGNYTHEIRKIGGYVNVGVDFGGNKSAHAFNATFITYDYQKMVIVKDENISRPLFSNQIEDAFKMFLQDLLDEGYTINSIRADSADPVLIRGLNNALEKSDVYYRVKGTVKTQVSTRIRVYQRMFNLYRLFILERCGTTFEAFENAVWSDKIDNEGKDIRLDDGTTNIDNLDAQEYSTEEIHYKLLKE